MVIAVTRQQGIEMIKGDGRKPLDLVISAGLLVVLVVICYRVLAPFIGLLVWSLILAIVLYPLHQWLARRLGGRQGGAATLMVVLASTSGKYERKASCAASVPRNACSSRATSMPGFIDRAPESSIQP